MCGGGGGGSRAAPPPPPPPKPGVVYTSENVNTFQAGGWPNMRAIDTKTGKPAYGGSLLDDR